MMSRKEWEQGGRDDGASAHPEHDEPPGRKEQL